MNVKLTAFTAAVLLLAACSQPAETSVAPASAASAEQSASAVQSLSSRDGMLTVRTVGAFADQSGNRELLPDGMAVEDIMLLQQDTQSGITLYAAALGAPKQEAQAYFANLKADLESLSDISELKIGAATQNRMDYSLRYGEDFNETCIAIHTAEQLYNVCANGKGVPTAQLTAVLKDVRLNKIAP